MAETLETILQSNTIPAAPELIRREEDHAVRCLACAHRCHVAEGMSGVCRVRFNRGGELRVPGGYVASLQIDPIEKKPFYHAFPGEEALSFGMMGCDLHCSYCQNWVTSQALRDKAAVSSLHEVSPDQMVRLALDHEIPAVVSTYNEPLITCEWAVEVFKPAREAGLSCGFVSNGNGTPEVLEYLRPYLDLYKVDLKGFRDKPYRQLGGVLQNVLDTITNLVAMDYWVEVVTLVVPGFNDSNEELQDIAKFLVGVSPAIPWHVTAFRPEYHMDDTPATDARTLMRAYEIGKAEGLWFVYPGNLPGRVETYENTYCPKCDELLIARIGYYLRGNHLRDGRCPKCGFAVPGFWSQTAKTGLVPPETRPE